MTIYLKLKVIQVSQHYEKSKYDFVNEMKIFMINKGFNEVINYSFLDKQSLENLGLEEKKYFYKESS